MRAELANLNDCAVPFLSRVAVNLSWHIYTPDFATFKYAGREFDNVVKLSLTVKQVWNYFCTCVFACGPILTQLHI